jgi:hypothetical protein
MENNLIIPAAGKSSRFPNMKPKWLLTHPQGDLVIERVLSQIDMSQYDRIIFTILKEHEENFAVSMISKALFGAKVELCVLEKQTSCSPETIYQTIIDKKLSGHLTIKDSDALVAAPFPVLTNFVCGAQIKKFNIKEICNKSFIIHNENDMVQDIQEKIIASDTICVGVYSLPIDDFVSSYKKIKMSPAFRPGNEMYVSHIISYLMNAGSDFHYVEAKEFVDWGTLESWRREQERHKTYFFDIDGVVLKNVGRYGKKNWYNTLELLEENFQVLKDLSNAGHQIIFTTARDKEAVKEFEKLLNSNDIKYKDIITDCYHSQRIIINDFAPTNPFPSCRAISLPRNHNLKDYVK